MPSFFVKQPDGRLARFSSVVDDFVAFDMTAEEAEQLILDELVEVARATAKAAVKRGIDDELPRHHGVYGDGQARWRDALETVESIHGKNARAQRERRRLGSDS
ncbi:MAG TPA: hypothetical protein VH062_01920 [Polyangiaceae bacterium]|jgi:hypothetical protein|nr:hypothetical protein [Polyangiaceae bacterium]